MADVPRIGVNNLYVMNFGIIISLVINVASYLQCLQYVGCRKFNSMNIPQDCRSDFVAEPDPGYMRNALVS